MATSLRFAGGLDAISPSISTTRSVTRAEPIKLQDILRDGPPESSLEASPTTAEPPGLPARAVVSSVSWPPKNRYRVATACMQYFGNGLHDAAPGALIPYIERAYGLGYALVSLIWIANAAGFIIAAAVLDAITARLGRARTLVLGEACMIAGYIIVVSPIPFPAVVVAYVIIGFGNAVNLSLNNVFCGNLNNSTVILGLAHGSYGVGGIASPLIATAMVSNGIYWSRFFLITLGWRVLCSACAGWSFLDLENKGQDLEVSPQQESKLALVGRALKNKTTILGALLVFAYQGAEVSVSGWFISYLIDYRDGDPARVGYVTAGFWGGITLGRFTIVHLAPRIGERLFVFILGIAAIGLQLLAWLVPDIIGGAVAVSLLGLALGPIYPCAQTVFNRLLPAGIQVAAIGFVSSAGSSGGAVVPFLTGLLAQVRGTLFSIPFALAFFLRC